MLEKTININSPDWVNVNTTGIRIPPTSTILVQNQNTKTFYLQQSDDAPSDDDYSGEIITNLNFREGSKIITPEGESFLWARGNSQYGDHMKLYVSEIINQTPSVSFKSLVLDMVNNWGRSNLIGIRSIDLYDVYGDIYTITVDNITVYGSTWIGSNYYPKNIYLTALSKTGAESGNCWLSYTGHTGSLRISLVLDDILQCTKIVINNYHNSGLSTDVGVRDMVVTSSLDRIASTSFNAPIEGGTVLFDGEVDKHVGDDVVDGQTLFSVD